MNRRQFLKSMGTAGVAVTVGGGGIAYGRASAASSQRTANESRSNAGLSLGRADELGSFRTIYSANVDTPLVALSFDDGPDPEFTPRILEILASRNLTATFCMMGHNVEVHDKLTNEVVSAGHEMANHTWTHRDLSGLDVTNTRTEIRTAHRIITDATGQTLRYFRPPRGRINGAALKVLAELNYDLLMWSVTGAVRGSTTASSVSDHVVSALHPGAIIGLHDGIGRGTFDRNAAFARELTAKRIAEIDALDDILDRGLDAGFSFVPVGELLEAERSGGDVSGG